MALDFYNWDDTKLTNMLFSFDDYHMNAFVNVQAEYKRLTGLYIDAYRTTRIHQSHVELIIEIINKAINNGVNNKQDKKHLLYIFECLKLATNGLLAVGD
jgi:hypothetical protein